MKQWSRRRTCVGSSPSRPARSTSSAAQSATRAVYGYDDLGRLVSAKDALAAVGEQPARYTYDEHGNVKTRVDKTGTTAYAVDELDPVVQLTDPALRVYQFSYDADGKLVRQDLPNATRAVLSYDPADRLTAYENETATGAPLAEYRYT
jgi:YD repeat-containing protein